MPNSDEKMKKFQRRALLRGLMVGGVALTVPFAGRALRAPGDPRRSAEPTEQPRGGPPWPLLAPVAAGSYLGSGWRVRNLSRVREGAAVLSLSRGSGERAEVHVCRRSGLPRGLAHTAQLDLLLMNDGDGDLPTPESLGRAVKTVALRVGRRERHEHGRPAAPYGLMSHSARLRWHGTPESFA
jgi:hypothetical protein